MINFLSPAAALSPTWVMAIVGALVAVEITDLQNIPGYGAFGVVMLVCWRILNKALKDSTSEYQKLMETHKNEKADLRAFYQTEIDRLRGVVHIYEQRHLHVSDHDDHHTSD